MTALPDIKEHGYSSSALYQAQAVQMEIEERIKLVQRAYNIRWNNGWTPDGYTDSIGQLMGRLVDDRTAWLEIERILKKHNEHGVLPDKTTDSDAEQ